MSARSLYIIVRCATIGLRVSLPVSVVSVAMVFVLGISADAQGVSDVLKASETVAGSMSTDVTRLALQVAALSMALNIVFLVTALRISTLFLQKPCLLQTSAGESVLRDAFWKATVKKRSDP